MRSVSALLLCAMALSGCYSYAPVSPAITPPPAADVRVRLSRPMDFPIRDVTVRDVVELQGEVVQAQDTSMQLSVFGLRSQTGFNSDANGETVAFPRTAVVGLSRKKLSPLRSSLFAALLLGGALAVRATGALSSGSQNGAGSSGGNTK
jgi:hypothetical protein